MEYLRSGIVHAVQNGMTKTENLSSEKKGQVLHMYDIDYEALNEAKRIKQLAELRFKAGTHLEAIFKNGRITKKVYYINPKDIPPMWRQNGIPYYLYSVRKANV